MSYEEAAKLYINSKIAQGCAKNTIEWYSHMTRYYGKWLAENNRTFDTVKLVDLQQYLLSLRARYSPATVRMSSTSLITFYRWAMDVELITTDPTVKLKRTKVPDLILPVAARSYVQHLMDSIKLWTWVDFRDKLIIQILFSTGVRISECTNLKVPDVDFEKRRLSIVGKGGKLRYQPFPEELVQPLKEWIERWRPAVPVEESPWMFFASTSRKSLRGPVTNQAIYSALKSRAETAALDWVPPHGYRRGFAVDMLSNGASTRLVMSLLGHASVVTTEKYLRLSPDLVHTEFDKKWQDLSQPTEAQPPATQPPVKRHPLQKETSSRAPVHAPTAPASEDAVTFIFWSSASTDD